jgi:hypothetical protein
MVLRLEELPTPVGLGGGEGSKLLMLQQLHRLLQFSYFPAEVEAQTTSLCG